MENDDKQLCGRKGLNPRKVGMKGSSEGGGGTEIIIDGQSYLIAKVGLK